MGLGLLNGEEDGEISGVGLENEIYAFGKRRVVKIWLVEQCIEPEIISS